MKSENTVALFSIASYTALLWARCALPQEEKGPGIHCLRMRQFSKIIRKPDIAPGYFCYSNRHSRRGKWDVSAVRGAMSAAMFLQSYSLNQLGLPNLSLKEEQRLAVKAIYEGRDVLV